MKDCLYAQDQDQEYLGNVFTGHPAKSLNKHVCFLPTHCQAMLQRHDQTDSLHSPTEGMSKC